MNATTLQSHTHVGNADDAAYQAYLGRVLVRFDEMAGHHRALFTTATDNLWQVYLASYPEHQRQYHNCNACRHFIERFGGLVVIDEQGVQTSPIWDEALLSRDIDEVRAVARLRSHVSQAKVTGVFLSSERVLGTALTGKWWHLSVALPKAMVHASRIQTAGQAMAEKREDFGIMQRALGEFTRPQIDMALRLLTSDALYRSEKVLGPAQFLSDLLTIRETVKRPMASQNLTWKRIAAAPAGFCHPRSSMIGTLLEDIAAGMDYDTVARRFTAKIDPLAYQRPQAAPSAGTIAEAERRVAQLGIERSLPRRFARPDELQALWKPAARAAETPAGGVFGHLTPKAPPVSVVDLHAPAQTMTWVKFRKLVLPDAATIEVFVPRVLHAVHFTTAVDADAPPILQWDSEEQRNPVAWYCWGDGGHAGQYYGVHANAFNTVALVTLAPFMWADEEAFSHQGARAAFVLDGARESREPSACLFPEILKSDLHSVRSVIEAYSRGAKLGGADGPHAIGLCVAAGKGGTSLRVRVTSPAGQRREIHIDRWD